MMRARPTSAAVLLTLFALCSRLGTAAAQAPPPLPPPAAPLPSVDPAPSPLPAPEPHDAAPAARAPAPAATSDLRVSSPPPAAPRAAAEAGDAGRLGAAPPSARGLRATLGLKVGYVATSGFDTFAKSDTLPQFSLEVSDGVFSRGRATLGIGLGLDLGGRSSDLRGLDADLTTARFAVPLEARWAFARPLWGVVRLSPGAAYAHARLKGLADPSELVDAAWGFSLDASAGAIVVLGGSGDAAKNGPRFVALPEVGYAFATPLALAPTPSRGKDEVLGSEAGARVPDVTLSGFFWRASVGVIF
jgi:hypothetical protein